jgi:acyl-[acyl carrier protein]--UDP-N-acetylglucosamine O-acyltransferase
MSHSPLNLTQALDGDCREFVAELRDPEGLARVRQTGFVWTRQPGVVCLAMTRRYLAIARENPDVAAIIAPAAALPAGSVDGKSLIVSERADELFHQLHLLQQSAAPVEDDFQIDPSAIVDPSAILRGSVRIEAGVRIGPRVVLSGPAYIARDARIDAGAVIGCDGLFVKSIRGVRRHMPHFGGVRIGDDARILAGAIVVRSAINGEDTRIGARTHVGILSNVGHDVQVGEGATISSNVVVAGRAKIGDQCWIGASATISNMVSIGNRAEVRLGSVVLQDVPEGGNVSGNFAMPHARHMRQFLEASRNAG